MKDGKFVGLLNKMILRYNQTNRHFTQDFQNKLLLKDSVYDKVYYEIQETINYGNTDRSVHFLDHEEPRAEYAFAF